MCNGKVDSNGWNWSIELVLHVYYIYVCMYQLPETLSNIDKYESQSGVGDVVQKHKIPTCRRHQVYMLHEDAEIMYVT